MDRIRPKFTNAEINNILYSGIRNTTHFRVRVKGYIIKIFQNIKFILFTPNTPNYRKRPMLLNDAPQKNWIKESDNIEVLTIERNNPEIRTLFLVEVLLLLAFLIKIKFIQRKLFILAYSQTSNFVDKYNVVASICGHPTILMCFIGIYLRTKNKNVITIQHGIYNLKRYKVLWFEKEVATHVVVYGSYFKELYSSQGVKANIQIGAPYFTSAIEPNEKKIIPLQLKKKKALFLGQQFYKVSSQVSKPYNELLTDLICYLEKKNIKLYYKPHPREDINKSLNKENIAKVTCFEADKSSDVFLNDFDTYYSVNSSLLLETYLQKKVCFQIDLPGHPKLDRFSDYSGIQMVSMDNIDTHLEILNYDFFYDPNYLNISKDPKKTISGLIMELI